MLEQQEKNFAGAEFSNTSHGPGVPNLEKQKEDLSMLQVSSAAPEEAKDNLSAEDIYSSIHQILKANIKKSILAVSVDSSSSSSSSSLSLLRRLSSNPFDRFKTEFLRMLEESLQGEGLDRLKLIALRDQLKYFISNIKKATKKYDEELFFRHARHLYNILHRCLAIEVQRG
ncbi:MAG: hypothetical protein K0Q74_475 [Gammaproteobacteria bacterium]|jgi:hypothetical protein|nr:hypothetical protein [Gammaproteobacteria bacterium]